MKYHFKTKIQNTIFEDDLAGFRFYEQVGAFFFEFVPNQSIPKCCAEKYGIPIGT